MLDRMPLMVFLANRCRQIVYSNPSFTKVIVPSARDRFVGLRPGEALGCVYAGRMEAGCGCSEYCRHCGAAQAILKSLQGVEDCRECHILARNAQGIHSLDMQILSRPFECEGQIMSLNIALDVSHERRLLGLKRTFLHSMINAAGGMDTMFTLLAADQAEDLPEHLPLLRKSALAMLHEVQYQYDFMAAESGQLVVRKGMHDMAAVADGLVRHIQGLPMARGRHITVQGAVCSLWVDPRLLRHVLFNLAVNALEAVPAGGSVRIKWEATAEGPRIDVENDGLVPEEIEAQFFKRYVSTKGEDRGLGLYAAKAFTENHLGGRLAYAPLQGITRFSVFLPKPQSTQS
jgi:signal transduction histidine kinase